MIIGNEPLRRQLFDEIHLAPSGKRIGARADGDAAVGLFHPHQCIIEVDEAKIKGARFVRGGFHGAEKPRRTGPAVFNRHCALFLAAALINIAAKCAKKTLSSVGTRPNGPRCQFPRQDQLRNLPRNCFTSAALGMDGAVPIFVTDNAAIVLPW